MKDKKLILIIVIPAIIILGIYIFSKGTRTGNTTAPFFSSEEIKNIGSEGNTLRDIQVEQEELQEQVRKQEIGDRSFVESATKLQDKYPWYREFPLINEKYLVVFDYEKESFRVVFKTAYSAELEKEIVEGIKQKTNTNNINYYIK